MKRLLTALALLAAAASASASEIEAGYGQDFLSAGYADWRDASLAATWSGERSSVRLAVRELERYGLRDNEVGAAVRVPLDARWGILGEASGSVTHHFMPAWSGALQLQYAPGAGFALSSGFKWTRYETDVASSGTQLGTVGVERYFGAHRIAWTGYLSTLAGSWSGSNRVAWDLFYGERGRIGISLSAGREIEALGGGELLTSRVLGAALGGSTDVHAGWSVTYELAIQRQGDLYTRTGGKLGLRRYF